MILLRPQFTCLALLFAGTFAAAPAAEPAGLDYHRDIAPLLRDYCAGCHNARDGEGGFSVETFAELREGGDTVDPPILVPGKPEESYLLQTILKTAKPAMPPKKEPQPSEAEIALLRRWIQEGAKGPGPEQDHSLLTTLSVPPLSPSDAVRDSITAAAFSVDGRWEAHARHGRIELRRRDSTEPAKLLKTSEGKINALHFSSDGAWLLAATGIAGLKGEALVFDINKGEVVKRFGEGEHRDILFDAVLSPDGKRLATAGYDQGIRLWDFASGELLHHLSAHNGAIYDLAFSPDGTVLASASGDGTCKLWLVSTGERLDTLNQPEGEQYRVDFTPDGQGLVALGADKRIRLWRFISKQEPSINPLLETRFAHEDAIVEMALSADGRLLATSSADRSLKLWNLPDLDVVQDLGPQSDLLSVLAFAPEGDSLFAARLDGTEERFALPPLDPGVVQTRRELSQEPSRTPEPPVPAEPSELLTLQESESGPNPLLQRPCQVKGSISRPGEWDDYPFTPRAGETWVFEVDAARSKSLLDSRIAVLHASGEPVEQVVLQALRESWLTFRGKDSTTWNDFRVHRWEDMELDELLYLNGEVVKLQLYPRGPDSGFIVYPGYGSRRTWFQTTPMAHPLGQPCYIVRALPAAVEPVSNGLPVFRLHYENDDDPERRLGTDSVLRFTVPADGDYLLRLGDTRGFGGKGYDYTLVARPLQPDFSVALRWKDLKVAPGSGAEIGFTATRLDGFDGPIAVAIEGLPPSLTASQPIEIEAGQDRAYATLRASGDFAGLSEEEASRVRVRARAKIGERVVEKELGPVSQVTATTNSQIRVRLLPDGESGRVGEDGVVELTMSPGETITALVEVERNGFEGEVTFGKEDAGRNLPHGVFVDNIGLNGLMIPVGENQQRLFLTAAKITAPTVREFHLRTEVDGGHTTPRVRLRVR